MVSVETKEVELESVSGKKLNRPGIDLVFLISKKRFALLTIADRCKEKKLS